MRALTALAIVTAGLALGYWIGTRTETAATADAPRARGIAARPARVQPPTAQDAAATVLAARPSPDRTASASWSALQDQLRRRALDGDAAAAAQWVETELACAVTARFDPEFLLRWGEPGSMPHLPHASDEEAARLTDPRESEERRAVIAEALWERFIDLCDGHRAPDAAEHYALARLAADGSERGFWWFVLGIGAIDLRADVLAGGDSAQIARLRDWSQRVPALLRQRGEQGDSRAALVLGVAYMTDENELNAPGLLPGSAINSMIDNDAAQAYRWLSLYLRTPQGAAAPQARQWLADIGTRLDAVQRDAAQRWADAQPAPQ